jgi:Fe-Mn family superoxide dismutase
MKPQGGGKPSDQLASRLDQAFQGLDNFRAEFKKAAEGQFGSGWAWLVLDRGKLKIVKTANADTPLVHRQTPLLACDVWEHAYYIDYRNRRGDFVQVFLDHLINWEFVARNLEQQEHEKAA